MRKSMYHNKRPKFLQLHRIHLPITAVISISHRITGVLLFLSLPMWLYLLQHSLSDPAGFAQVQDWLSSPLWRLSGVLVLWWFIHHLLAGVRVLLLDIELGVELPRARASASGLMVASLVLLLILLVVVL